jgi:ribonuclease BN (tRNA processing enzyme)
VWQTYHSSFHTSGPELGEIAAEAQPGMLILYHQLLWGATVSQLVEEIRVSFDGVIVYGNDLDVF